MRSALTLIVLLSALPACGTAPQSEGGDQEEGTTSASSGATSETEGTESSSDESTTGACMAFDGTIATVETPGLPAETLYDTASQCDLASPMTPGVLGLDCVGLSGLWTLEFSVEGADFGGNEGAQFAVEVERISAESPAINVRIERDGAWFAGYQSFAPDLVEPIEFAWIFEATECVVDSDCGFVELVVRVASEGGDRVVVAPGEVLSGITTGLGAVTVGQGVRTGRTVSARTALTTGASTRSLRS